jgi:hypothetical protein
VEAGRWSVFPGKRIARRSETLGSITLIRLEDSESIAFSFAQRPVN